MTIKLMDNKTYEVTALREELVKDDKGGYWSLRSELVGATSTDVTNEFVPSNFRKIAVSDGEDVILIEGYTELESANIIYNPTTFSTNCIIRLKKEVV